jgi:hypothetical protein
MDILDALMPKRGALSRVHSVWARAHASKSFSRKAAKAQRKGNNCTLGKPIAHSENEGMLGFSQHF